MSDRPYKAEQRRGHSQHLVMATLTKPKRTKASIMVSEANTFESKQIIFEAKRKRPTVNKLFSKLSEATPRLTESGSRGNYFVQVVGIYLNMAIFAT